jgi:hypothetical protein
MNRAKAVEYRKRMLAMAVHLAKQAAHPDPEAEELLKRWFGYPDDLDDLRELKVDDNLRPEGATTCFFVRRIGGELPDIY